MFSINMSYYHNRFSSRIFFDFLKKDVFFGKPFTSFYDIFMLITYDALCKMLLSVSHQHVNFGEDEDKIAYIHTYFREVDMKQYGLIDRTYYTQLPMFFNYWSDFFDFFIKITYIHIYLCYTLTCILRWWHSFALRHTLISFSLSLSHTHTHTRNHAIFCGGPGLANVGLFV